MVEKIIELKPGETLGLNLNVRNIVNTSTVTKFYALQYDGTMTKVNICAVNKPDEDYINPLSDKNNYPKKVVFE